MTLTRHWLVHTCPHCGTEQSAVASSDNIEGPQAGDITVCLDCLLISVFDLNALDGQLVVRKPTPEELHEYSRDPEVAHIGAMALLAKRVLK